MRLFRKWDYSPRHILKAKKIFLKKNGWYVIALDSHYQPLLSFRVDSEDKDFSDFSRMDILNHIFVKLSLYKNMDNPSCCTFILVRKTSEAVHLSDDPSLKQVLKDIKSSGIAIKIPLEDYIIFGNEDTYFSAKESEKKGEKDHDNHLWNFLFRTTSTWK